MDVFSVFCYGNILKTFGYYTQILTKHFDDVYHNSIINVYLTQQEFQKDKHLYKLSEFLTEHNILRVCKSLTSAK